MLLIDFSLPYHIFVSVSGANVQRENDITKEYVKNLCKRYKNFCFCVDIQEIKMGEQSLPFRYISALKSSIDKIGMPNPFALVILLDEPLGSLTIK